MARVKPLADLIEACIGPAFAAQGFTSSDILAAWPEIVGARLARACQPVKLEWPRGVRRGRGPGSEAGEGGTASGTLVVRVEGAFALELQHLAPVVIGRINAHYGWACVGRIVMRQDRLHRGTVRQAIAALDPLRRGEVARAVSRIEADGLRAALDRLGQAVEATRVEAPRPAGR